MNNKLIRKFFAAVCVLAVADTSNLRAASLIWSGTSTPATNWDVGVTANWKISVASSFFNNGDIVSFTDSGITTAINLATNVQPTGITNDSTSHNYSINGTNAITGTAYFVKNGSSTLTLNSSNAFTGGLTISNGTVTLGNAYGAGSGIITLAGGTLNLGSTIAPGNTLNNVANSTITGASAGGQVGINKVTGSNTLNIAITTGTGNVFDFRGDMTAFSGTISLGTSTNNLRLNGTAGSSLATFDLGTGSVLMSIRDGATSIALGGLAGGSNTILRANSSVNWGAVFNIGANNNNTTFNGLIANGGGGANALTSISKVGTGTLTLAGTNTFTGATTVSSGALTLTNTATLTNSSIITVNAGATLNLAGTFPFSELNIYTNKTLTGGGVINASSVAVGTGGTISPGDGVGTLTVSNGTVSSAGNFVMELNRTSPATNDQLKASAITISGGTLIVTNLGPDLQTGDSFKLFSTAIGGGFTTISLPASNALNTVQYVWTNRLALDGTIRVLSGTGSVSTTPTNLVFSINSGHLNLSWPADHLGWELLVQTNSRAIGLGTNWAPLPATIGVTNFSLPLDPNNGSVFLKMVYPPK